MSDSVDYRKFDPLDYEIIKELKKNVRLSSAEIARKINANERTVRRRIDKFTKTGALQLTGILNPRAFGYFTAVDIFINIVHEEREHVIDEFLHIPEISYVAFAYGHDHDISIQARFKDNESIFVFLEKTLPSFPGVSIKGYALVPRVVKPAHEWLPRMEDFGIYEDNNEE